MSNKGKSLKEFYENALGQTEKAGGCLDALLLTGTFPIEEINSPFVSLNLDKAKEWQATQPPPNLIFNHGQFVFSENELGYSYIKNELEKNVKSNRACISLVNMPDILNSKKKELRDLPSFLVLQATQSTTDHTELIVSAYFRALEIMHFLPINISEICIVIKEISIGFPHFSKFRLSIFANRAQIIKDFNCLEKAKLDYVKKHLLSKAVLSKEYGQIIEWLSEKKKREESVVITDGLKYLADAFQDENVPVISKLIYSAIEKLNILKSARQRTSVHKEIEAHWGDIRTSIETIISRLEELKSAN